MIKTALLLTALISTITFAKAQNVVYDANAQTRNVSGFYAIQVAGGIDIYLAQGSNEGVAVSAGEEKFIHKIKTEVKEGVLMIWYDNDKSWWSDKTVNNKKLKAYVTVKEVKSIQASGASDVYVQGRVQADELKLKMSGASDFKGAINCFKLSISNSGASDIHLTGAATHTKITMSGASAFKNYDFVTDYCDIHVSGASHVKITVNKEMNASASGASSVSYKGTAAAGNISSSGAGSVKKKS